MVVVKITLDTGDVHTTERDGPFATACMLICREGFTVGVRPRAGAGVMYWPGRRVQRIELMETTG